MASRAYTTPAGDKYPLREAKYNVDFKVYRSDRRKAKPGDPGWCLIAMGIKRNRNVLEAYIGSGHDAYIIFKEQEDEPAHAVHFVIRATAKKILDAFDHDRSSSTQPITLMAPPSSWTLSYRRKSNARRRAEIKNGAAVKHRTRPNRKIRITRLTRHRPRAKISDSGSVSMLNEQAAA